MRHTTTVLTALAVTAGMGLAGLALAQGPAKGDRGPRGDSPAAWNRGPGGMDCNLDGPRGNGPDAWKKGPRAGGMERGPRGPEGPNFGDRARFWDDEDLVQAIGLSDQQVNLLEKSYQETEAALEASEGTGLDHRKAVREALDQDAPNLAEVNAAIDAATAAQSAKMKALLGHRVVVKNVLTVEQEEGMREFRRERARQMRDEAREAAREVRDLVRELADDEGLSEEDRAEIQAALEDLDPRIRQRIEQRLDRVDRPRGNWGPADAPEAPRKMRVR